ncbi:MAG: amidohydrolase family protein [Planctomycetota bacterium]|nr:amidohydrolase family protein [Planctomycetota bacterium]
MSTGFLITDAGVFDGNDVFDGDILVVENRIYAVARGIVNRKLPRIDGNGWWVLPGLINAHDHLDWTASPRLGRGPYANSYQWAGDVHLPETEPVASVLSMSDEARLMWGGLKCVISGVTTVMHHNPLKPLLTSSRFPVHVFHPYRWSHSPGFSKSLQQDFEAYGGQGLFFIHCAEGTDDAARGEFQQLDRLEMLDCNTVLIHGVGLGVGDIPRLKSSGCRLVWCPSSNEFLLGGTVEPAVLRSGIPVALGSDSSVSAEGHLIDELRAAARTGVFSPLELLKLVTSQAAVTLNLTEGRGSLVEGGVADLFAIRRSTDDPAADLLNSSRDDVEAVVCNGRVLMWKLNGPFADECVECDAEIRGLHRIRFPLQQLMTETPSAVLDALPNFLKDVYNTVSADD